LNAPAKELGVTVKRSEPVSQNNAPGLFSRPALLQAAFSDDVLEAGHNSEVIELSPELFVTLRVAERRPPALMPLEQVRDTIAAELREETARAAAAAQAEALLAELASGTSVEEAANAAGLQWQVELGARRDSNRLPAEVRDRAFAMTAPEEGAVERAIVDSDADATYLVELARVSSGQIEQLPPEERAQLRQRIAGESGGVLQQQLETTLRNRAEVVIY
jgi:peptidyl-prolyl cis-trans isomerase D